MIAPWSWASAAVGFLFGVAVAFVAVLLAAVRARLPESFDVIVEVDRGETSEL